jgi:hypothetical protein
LPSTHPAGYRPPIRKDPVQFRVAIPAADPPDNIPRTISTKRQMMRHAA